jgi:hypothetical protein
MVLSFEEWKKEHEKRINSGYLIQDINKQLIWKKILYEAYERYLAKEEEEKGRDSCEFWQESDNNIWDNQEKDD